MPPLVALASNEDPNSRGEACRCLANLSVNPDTHQIIIKEGVLGALVSSLASSEFNCQRFASLCIANLATTVAAQVKVIQAGAIRPLIALGTNPTFQIESRRYFHSCKFHVNLGISLDIQYPLYHANIFISFYFFSTGK